MLELRPYTHKNSTRMFDPFRELEEMERQFFGHLPSMFGEKRLPDFKTDIKEADNEYLLEADLPGCEKKDIHLELNADQLTIRAERHSEHEQKDKKDRYLRCERSYGMYQRSFDVSAIDTEHITAKYDNGVLRVTLPKKEQVLPAVKTLEIQ